MNVIFNIFYNFNILLMRERKTEKKLSVLEKTDVLGIGEKEEICVLHQVFELNLPFQCYS